MGESPQEFHERIARNLRQEAAKDRLDWTPYGQERWDLGEITDAFEKEIQEWPISNHVMLGRRPKPFLTAADLVMLREMKVGL